MVKESSEINIKSSTRFQKYVSSFPKMDLVPMIYHEQQQGQLCAQHALNNLLQQQLYSPIDLSDLGSQLDKQESEFGLKDKNQNYDDSGYFSIQVMEQALMIWGIELVPFKSSLEFAQQIQQDICSSDGYICNLNQHWYTLRRFGGSRARWYNLNSTLKTPAYVTETYLELLLTQITEQGYSIYIIRGNLPPSDADLYARENPIPAKEFVKFEKSETINLDDDMDEEMRKAIKESLKEGDDDEVQKAIQLSLGQKSDLKGKQKRVKVSEDDDEIEKAIQASLMPNISNLGGESSDLQGSSKRLDKHNEEDDIQRAIEMSLGSNRLGESSGEIQSKAINVRIGPVIPPEQTSQDLDLEEMRQKRLERFGK